MSEDLELLTARVVAEAASDYFLAKRDAQFARLNGGVRKLEKILSQRVAEWECAVDDTSDVE